MAVSGEILVPEWLTIGRQAMRKMKLFRFSMLALAAALLVGATGCTVYPARPGGPAVAYPGYYYDYYYYPNVDVYFHVYTGDYWYRSGDRWISTRTLPPRFYLDPRYRRTLQIRDDRPVAHFDKYRKQYGPRPGQRFERDRRSDDAERRQNERQWRDYQRRDRGERRSDR